MPPPQSPSKIYICILTEGTAAASFSVPLSSQARHKFPCAFQFHFAQGSECLFFPAANPWLKPDPRPASEHMPAAIAEHPSTNAFGSINIPLLVIVSLSLPVSLSSVRSRFDVNKRQTEYGKNKSLQRPGKQVEIDVQYVRQYKTQDQR